LAADSDPIRADADFVLRIPQQQLLGALLPRVHACLANSKGSGSTGWTASAGRRGDGGGGGGFSAQELSNVLWSLAVLPDGYDADLFDHAAAALLSKRRPFRPRLPFSPPSEPERDAGTAGTVSSGGMWGASGLGASRGGLRSVKRSMLYRRRSRMSRPSPDGGARCLLDELKPLEIGKIAWAFAKVKRGGLDLCERGGIDLCE
jgi:hypothetical protein